MPLLSLTSRKLLLDLFLVGAEKGVILNNKNDEANKTGRQAAVALKKFGVDDKSVAKIVAAGYGKLAEEIIRLAFENGIKVREDKDLAQMLAAVELDSDIPSEALVAIAEILAYVYKANGTYQPIKESEEDDG